MVERPDLIFYNQRAAVAQWWSACLKSKASGVRFTPAARWLEKVIGSVGCSIHPRGTKFKICGYSTMVVRLLAKQDTGVRFPLPAPGVLISTALWCIQYNQCRDFSAATSLNAFWILIVLKGAYPAISKFMNFYPPIGPLLGLYIFSTLIFVLCFFAGWFAFRDRDKVSTLLYRYFMSR